MTKVQDQIKKSNKSLRKPKRKEYKIQAKFGTRHRTKTNNKLKKKHNTEN